MDARVTQDAINKALAHAFYALHDQLVEAGAIEVGAVSGALRRFRPGDTREAADIAALLHGMANNLDQAHCSSAGTPAIIGVIEGGKVD